MSERTTSARAADRPADARRWTWSPWIDAVLVLVGAAAIGLAATAVADALGSTLLASPGWWVVGWFAAYGAVGAWRARRLARGARAELVAQERSGRLDVGVWARAQRRFVGPAVPARTRVRVVAGELALGDDDAGYRWPAGTWATGTVHNGWRRGVELRTPNGSVLVSVVAPGDPANGSSRAVDLVLASSLSALRRSPDEQLTTV